MSYPLSDKLNTNLCKHCAPLFIIEEHWEITPTAEVPNATLTFIKLAGRTYGITCRHVVENLHDRIAKAEKTEVELSYTFFVALKQHHTIQDRFVIPPEDLISPEPDIAICELHTDFPNHVGKIALDIDAHPLPPLSEVSFAVAVGFPNRLKTQSSMPLGHELTMPCVYAVADSQPTGGHSFTLYSDLQFTPDIRDFSGMSGGPIYWSNEATYGLLGITYGSSQLEESIFPINSIHIKGHLADRRTLERWVSCVPHLYEL